MLPDNLIKSTNSLEERAQSLQISNKKILFAEWELVSQTIGIIIPDWLIELLANHGLAFMLLERPHECEDWTRYFLFWPPSWYADWLKIDQSIMSQEILNDVFFLYLTKAAWICGLPARQVDLHQQFTYLNNRLGKKLWLVII